MYMRVLHGRGIFRERLEKNNTQLVPNSARYVREESYCVNTLGVGRVLADHSYGRGPAE